MAKAAGVTGPDLAGLMVNISKAIGAGSKATVSTAALSAKRIHEREIARVAGADMALSGVGTARGKKGNTKVGVRFTLEGNANTPQAFIKATGPLHIVERNTAGHVIRSAYSKGKRRKGFVGPASAGQFTGGRNAAVNIPGVGFRRSARHPGTTGQHPWRKGATKAAPVIRKTMSSRTASIVKKAAKP